MEEINAITGAVSEVSKAAGKGLTLLDNLFGNLLKPRQIKKQQMPMLMR